MMSSRTAVASETLYILCSASDLYLDGFTLPDECDIAGRSAFVWKYGQIEILSLCYGIDHPHVDHAIMQAEKAANTDARRQQVADFKVRLRPILLMIEHQVRDGESAVEQLL